MVKPEPDERLAKYRTAESALKDFFSADNFCFRECISREKSRYQGKPQTPGRIACCDNNYFEMFFDLDLKTPTMVEFVRKQKENATGHNHHTGECDYHSETGCQVKCYNSPICLAYACEAYKSYLQETYQIKYTTESIDVLENILKGEGTKRKLEKWLTKVQKATKRIKSNKKSKGLAKISF